MDLVRTMLSAVSRCVLFFPRHVRKQGVNDAIYAIIFFYLILFSIFNTLYVDTDMTPRSQPVTYDIQNVEVNPVHCSFSISSQYQRTPRCICYLLLILTVTIRSHVWLAAGAAASMLTYSGVAAIHLLILFATNNRLHPPWAKGRCNSIPVPGSSIPFIACAGIADPDSTVVLNIVSVIMLGALPTAAWSTTFRNSASKAVLMFWLLLLALGHTFSPFINTNWNHHFQICPKNHVEPLPKTSFQAPSLNDAWSRSFHSLVLASQQASSSFENDSIPACLYTCFATTAYIGRSSDNIIIFSSGKPGFVFKNNSESRLAIDMFWWFYTFLALLTLFTIENKSRLPKWVHKQVFSFKHRQQPWVSLWKCVSKNRYTARVVIRRQAKDSNNTADDSFAAAKLKSSKKIQITILKLIQLITQLISVSVFGGSIIYTEITQYSPAGTLLEQEPFTAVGQWSCVAVVSLVIFAAVVSRLWAADEVNRGTGNVAVVKIRCLEQDNEEWIDEGVWDLRVGYAS